MRISDFEASRGYDSYTVALVGPPEAELLAMAKLAESPLSSPFWMLAMGLSRFW
jgi:hypothetical protein